MALFHQHSQGYSSCKCTCVLSCLRCIVWLGCLIVGVFFRHPSLNAQQQPSPPPWPGLADDTTKVDTSRNLFPSPFPFDVDTSDTSSRRLIDSLQRGRDSLLFPHEFEDSLRSGADTSVEEDTIQTWEVYLDSTVRVEQFVHRRYDAPVVNIYPPINYSLYLNIKSPAYKRELQLDSTGKLVTIRETVNGLDVKVPLVLPLEEYIRLRLEQEKQTTWRSFANEYTSQQTKDALGGLLSSLTKIEIPVPANPLLSIFGKPTINLNISGGVDIRGAFRRQQSDQVTFSALDRVRNEPDFKQDVQIRVDGKIGDKLDIGADWNTQRTFEFENQLKIKYTGYEDEIVQTVEAGNVSLQTPSLVGGGQALFGIKTHMQMGPLKLTSLLSQKKGQSREITVSGGSQQSEHGIYPYGYSKSYYFVDTLYRKYWEVFHSGQIPRTSSEIEATQIVRIDVWVSRTGTLPDPSERQADAYIDLPARSVAQPFSPGDTAGLSQELGRYETGRFIRLDPAKDYKFTGNQAYGGYIILNTNVTEEQVIAVSYRIAGPDRTGGTEDDLVYGSLTEEDTISGGRLVFKLIKPRFLEKNPNYKPAWDLWLKNVYAIGGRDLKKEGFDFRIIRRTNGPEAEDLFGHNLLRVFGLDRFNQENAEIPDGEFDFIPGTTVDIERAEIIFPTLRPFDSTIVGYFRTLPQPIDVPDSLLFSDVYDTTQQAAQNNTIKNNYTIKVTSSTAQTSRYNLGFNVVEGSVQVLLNGSPLVPNVDYTVDYIVGEVILRKPEALAPGANVQVKYEQNDLFQLASKTLIGARGEMDPFPNTKLGFTVMNLNQATLSDKVRIGEEPTNNLIMGIDGSTAFNAPFLTDAIDALPFYRTKEMSTIKFGGEVAYILPDPNTKKSTVASDRGASIAYIDDFEGARRTIPLPINFSGWRLASPPADGVPDTVKYRRARFNWYNRLPSDVLSKDIWPDRDVRRGSEYVTVLNLDYDPNRRGPYNFSPNLPRDIRTSPDKNWAAVMRYISSSAGNIIDQNIQYLELWMKASSLDSLDLRRGRLYVNLGRISEDVITDPSGKLHSEDLVVIQIPNGVLNPGEDVGLDMLSDAQELVDPTIQTFLESPLNAGDPDVDRTDPSGDNWFSSGFTDYSGRNGTEANGTADEGRLPDTEDLNGDGEVNTTNSYLEYEIPLDSLYTTSLNVDTVNTYIVGGGINRNKWYQYRIPLVLPARIVGAPSAQAVLQNVQYVRLWVSGFSQPVSIRIAEINLVGNQWQELLKNDSIMKVTVVNIEDNPEYAADRPPGVIRERDRTQPDQIIEGNEQSLALVLNSPGLQSGNSRQAVKYFTARPLDLFNYKSMKMLVHGDSKFIYFGPDNYDAEIFIRFGADTVNFYEYRQPLHPGWYRAGSGDLNEININFEELTAVKATRLDSLNRFDTVVAPSGPPGAKYGVRGNPSLRQIRYIGIGITSRAQRPLTGEVWVNELRLVDVDNSSGIAYRVSTDVKLADIGAVGFNYAQTDPNFHALDQRFGSRNTTINWAVNTSFALDRFLPSIWQGTSIPIGYSHRENIVQPKYLPNTDIVVEEAAGRAALVSPQDATRVRTEAQTLGVSDSYSVSNFKIVPPIKAWYVRDTFSKLSFGFNYAKSSARDPSFAERRNWSWNFKANYGVSLPTDYYIQPFKKLFGGVFILKEFKDWKFYYVPFTNLSGSLTGQRSRTFEVPRAKNSVPRDTRGFGATKSFGLGWKLTEGGLTNLSGNYDLSIDRNLLSLDTDSSGRDFFSIVKTMLFKGRDSRYGQRVTINSKPRIFNILGIEKYLDLSMNYGVSYGWQNAFQQGDIGKSAGWDNSIKMDLSLRLKSLTDPWFQFKEEPQQPKAPQEKKDKDTTKSKETGGKKKSQDILTPLKTIGKVFIKIPFLDYETISIGFEQRNRSGNSGVVGTTGFLNFWGRLPFQGSSIEYGPSRLYQLGLISDPSGELRYSPKSSFPFIGWETIRGRRAPNASLSDQFSQSNNITLRTNRPLWQGATLDVNWKVGWQFSKTTTLRTDNLGNPTPGTITTSGSVERSFLTLPPVLFLTVFKSNLEDVGKKFDKKIEEGEPVSSALAESFEEGLEALPILNKVFGQFVPRPNWTLRWDGIERIAGIKSFIQRMSLEHSYNSSFRRDFRGDPLLGEQTTSERVSYGFSPLAAINVTFKDMLKGHLDGNVRFNSTTTYDLNVTAQNIGETFSQEIALSLRYSRRGFSFPIFGLNLSNDVDVSLTLSRTKNSRRTHYPRTLATDQDGVPLEGSTRTQIEPRIQYVLSTRVRAALFYRYTKVAPDEGGSRIFGTTTNEAGLDIHISI
ncbi:MAG: cell surface protein SprA [Ignavibacteriae bacterium]|nr:cell surface protein SprA [Ignavibacteriota bacterium]